jgi:hypothetical protein
MNYIISVIKEFKNSLLLIYFYVFVVQLVFLAEPYVLGKTIDGLLVKDYNWLIAFIGLILAGNLFTYKQMVFDTKVYTQIYNKLIFAYLDHDKDSSTSTKIARTDMANNIVNFLEGDISYYIMSIISATGSLCFIFAQNTTAGFIAAACILPVIFIVRSFYKKIAQGTRVSNSLYEQKASAMHSGDINMIHTFFLRRRRVIIAQSTIQGKNWTSLQMSRGFFLIMALVVFTHDSIGLTQGQAVSMYSYIFQFLISLMSIPVGMETFTRMKDVISRIKTPLQNHV